MNKKIKIIEMIFYISTMLYCIVLQYYIGSKVDLINWNDDIERYRTISVIGGVLCIVGMFVIRKKETKVIKIIKKALNVLIVIAVICTIIFIPKWDEYTDSNGIFKEDIFYEYGRTYVGGLQAVQLSETEVSVWIPEDFFEDVAYIIIRNKKGDAEAYVPESHSNKFIVTLEEIGRV